MVAPNRDDGPPSCTEPDTAWSDLVVPEGATAVDEVSGSTLAFTVTSAHHQVEDGGLGTSEVDLRVEMINETPADPDTHEDDEWYTEDNFDTLLADGLAMGDPSCFAIVFGDQNVEPGQRTIALVGFETTEDLTGARLVLQTDGEREIEVTASV